VRLKTDWEPALSNTYSVLTRVWSYYVKQYFLRQLYGLIFTSPAVVVPSIVISVPVCMSVCISVCLLAYLNNHSSNFTKCSVHMAVAGTFLTAMRYTYILYFRFVDDVILSYDYRPESKTKGIVPEVFLGRSSSGVWEVRIIVVICFVVCTVIAAFVGDNKLLFIASYQSRSAS